MASVGGAAVLQGLVGRPRRQDRDARHLRGDQAVSLLNAWAFAEDRKTPLDLHIVVHWEGLGLVAGQSILKAQARFLDRLGKWLRKRGKPLAYAWTIEFPALQGPPHPPAARGRAAP